MREQNARGANIVAQIALRGNGVLMGWQTTVHPFSFKPAWQEIESLPWDEQLAKLKDDTFKARMISEENQFPDSDVRFLAEMIAGAWNLLYEMGPGFNYEPTAEETLQAGAARSAISGDEYAYEVLMRDEGQGFIYFPILNYRDGNLDFLEELQHADDCVNSLSDGGAHCGTICDAASPTFMLEYWVRDRRKGRLSLQHAIKRQCRDTAVLYGLDDRGLLAAGYLADINVIDMKALKLERPWLAFDLPAGGKRLLQRARGYVATIKSGRVTFRDGVMQGPTPGGVIRGPQPAPGSAAGRVKTSA
jgi:N-acyl-D-aspartate/D-glutamate deacylase